MYPKKVGFKTFTYPAEQIFVCTLKKLSSHVVQIDRKINVFFDEQTSDRV